MQRRRWLPWRLCWTARSKDFRAAAGAEGSWVVLTTEGTVLENRAPRGLRDHLRSEAGAIRAIAIGPAAGWATISSDGRLHHEGLPAATAAGLDAVAAHGPLRSVALGKSGWVAVSDSGADRAGWYDLPWECGQVLTNLYQPSRSSPAAALLPGPVMIGPGDEWLIVTQGHFWSAGIPSGMRSALISMMRQGRTVETVARISRRGWLIGAGASGPPTPAPPLVRYERGGRRPHILDRLHVSRVPGVAVAAVVHGEPAATYCHGVQRAGGTTAVSAGTVFQAASISKPVTALAVLQLVAAGRLPLDEDVRPLCAWPIETHPLLGSAGLDFPGPTVRQLLAHRGGIAGRGTSPDRSGGGFARGGGGSLRLLERGDTAVPTLAESWEGAARHAPLCITHPPGTRVSYSGAGYLILQHLVEQVTSRSFAEHAAGALFTPIGCRFATFDLRPPTQWPLASGHDTEGRPLSGERELIPWSAAGGLYSTAGDLALILATILGRGIAPSGEAVAPADMIELMLAEGLGVFRRPPLVRHGGDNRGFRAVMLADPASRNGVVVLTNGRATDGVALRNDLAQRLRGAYGW